MRRVVAPAIVAFFACWVATEIGAADFARIVVSPRESIVGEIVRENDQAIEILDLATGRSSIHYKNKVKSIEKGISEAFVKKHAGLANYAAWKIRKIYPSTALRGRVADVRDGKVFINIGVKQRVSAGEILDVYREGVEIKDPISGKSLGKRQKRIARLAIAEVFAEYSEARVTDGNPLQINKGDHIRRVNPPNAIAILPLVNLDGQRIVGGRKLSEQLTTGIVRRGVPVVERTLLAKTLNELAIQQTGLFDRATAQKCGKQLGAFAVLLGTMSKEADGDISCQLRLVSVKNGRILFAASHRLDGTEYSGNLLTDNPFAATAPSIRRARSFLVRLVDDNLQLVPAFRGSQTFYLSPDNYLTAKILATSHSDVARRIIGAMKKHGYRRSGRIQIVFGEAPDPFPLRQVGFVTLQRKGERTLRSERINGPSIDGWEAYADMRFFAAIALAESAPTQARRHLAAGLKMWDGRGFKDAATTKRYPTFKLALAIIAAKKLKRTRDVPRPAITRLKSLQLKEGGWPGSYTPDGAPYSFARVHPTCMAIIALEGLAN